MNIVSQVRRTMDRFSMTEPGELVVVAVSGGPDSVCLLHVLGELSKELDIDMVVAHYNHGLREGEDESETQLVKKMAESMGLPFVTERALHLEPGAPSLEEKARDARYIFLEKIRKNSGAQKIAVGHNLNDQAETVLMRLLRGSGQTGLGGIRPMRDNRIIRPLIEIKREDIMTYLNARGLPYALDRSNLDTAYYRNRIRLELLPLLLNYQPKLIDHLGHLSNIIREEDGYLDSKAAAWVKRESVKDPRGNLSLQVPSLVKLHPSLRKRVIRILLKKIGRTLFHISRNHIRAVSGIMKSGNPHAMVNLPNDTIVKRVYNRLVFLKGDEPVSSTFHYSFEGPGTFPMEEIGSTIIIEEIEDGPDRLKVKKNHEFTALFDADIIRYPLIIRNFNPGDRFVPLGLRGHKKVKDFFIDLKIPLDLRAVIPILTSHNSILWIC